MCNNPPLVARQGGHRQTTNRYNGRVFVEKREAGCHGRREQLFLRGVVVRIRRSNARVAEGAEHSGKYSHYVVGYRRVPTYTGLCGISVILVGVNVL